MRVAVVADTGRSTESDLGVQTRLDAAVHRLRALGAEVVAIVDDPARVPAGLGIESTSGFGFAPGRGSRASDRRRRRLDELRNQPEDVALWAEPGTVLGAARNAIVAADAVLVSGGRLDPAQPSLVFSRLAALELATRNGIPAVMSSQYLSPLLGRSPSTSAVSTKALRLVGVSDERSIDTARRWLGDIAVCLQVDDAVSVAEDEPEGIPGLDACRRSGYVAVAAGHSGYLDDADLIRGWADLVDHIGKLTGRPVVFIPVSDDRAPGNPGPRVEEGLASAAGDPGAVVWCPPLTGREVAWIVRRADSVVTSSDVPLVLGLAAGIPSLALYSSDISAATFGSALAGAGLPGWRLPIDALSNRYAADVFTELWRRRDELADSAGAAVADWAASLDRHWEEVWERLGHPDRVVGSDPGGGRRPAPTGAAGTGPSTGPVHEMNDLMQAQYGRLDRAEQEWSEVFEEAEEYALDLEAALAERTKELVSLRRHLEAVDSEHRQSVRAAEDGWVLKDELESRLAESERLRALAEAHQLRAEDDAERAGRAARSAHERIAGLNARLAHQADFHAELQDELAVTRATLEALLDTKTFRWLKPLRRLYGAATRRSRRPAAPVQDPQGPGATP